MRTREEVDEKIAWLEKRNTTIIEALGLDYPKDPEYLANRHYIYALMWAKGFVSYIF